MQHLHEVMDECEVYNWVEAVDGAKMPKVTWT